MKPVLTVFGATLLWLQGVAWADCSYPKAPEGLPDGKAATQPEMVAAMASFKQYNADVDAYVACLDEETTAKTKDAAGVGAIMQIKAIQAKKKSSATEEREAKIAAFNKAVREFKAKG